MRNAILGSLLCSCLFALPARAAGKEGAVKAFNDAVTQGNGDSLLSLWPRAGAVKLFGKKVARPAAEKALAQKDGVYRLLRWHGPEADTGAGPVPPAEPREKDGKLLITTSGYGKQPECALESVGAGVWVLSSCRLIDNGVP